MGISELKAEYGLLRLWMYKKWSPRGMSENPFYRDGDLDQYGPALPAAVYMAFSSDETPTGKLPVNPPKLENYSFANEKLYERGFGLGYTSEALMCCCVYYDTDKRLIAVKQIEKDKTVDEAKTDVSDKKPQNATYAKMFIFRNDMSPVAETIEVPLT